MREKACKFVLHGCVQSKISSNVIIKKKIAPNPLLLKMLLENRLNLRDLLAFICDDDYNYFWAYF